MYASIHHTLSAHTTVHVSKLSLLSRKRTFARICLWRDISVPFGLWLPLVMHTKYDVCILKEKTCHDYITNTCTKIDHIDFTVLCVKTSSSHIHVQNWLFPNFPVNSHSVFETYMQYDFLIKGAWSDFSKCSFFLFQWCITTQEIFFFSNFRYIGQTVWIHKEINAIACV